MNLTPEAQAKAEQTVWGWFASAHPHEAADLNWARFVAFVSQRTGDPAITEDEIRATLRETEE